MDERPVALIAEGEGERVELLEMCAGDEVNTGTGPANVRGRVLSPGLERQRERQTPGK